MLLYLYDDQFIYTVSGEYDPLKPIPPMSTTVEPPHLVGTQVAQWTGAHWVVLSERPPRPTPPVPPLAELQAAALARINAEYEARTAALAAGYPPSERESWPVQIAESAIVRGADDQPTPWIDQAAPARGVTRLGLANLIHAQDLAYRQYHGTLTGIRQALRDDIAAVPDDEHAQEALDAIVWPPDPEPEP